MELHARLIHSEPGLRVVEVRASRGEYSLGSTLAEAGTAQEAEDLAVARLLQRLRDAERSDESIPLRSPPPVRRPAPAPPQERPATCFEDGLTGQGILQRIEFGGSSAVATAPPRPSSCTAGPTGLASRENAVSGGRSDMTGRCVGLGLGKNVLVPA